MPDAHDSHDSASGWNWKTRYIQVDTNLWQHGWTGPAKPTGISNKVSPPLPTSCQPEAPALGHATIGKNPETQLIGVTTKVAQTKVIDKVIPRVNRFTVPRGSRPLCQPLTNQG